MRHSLALILLLSLIACSSSPTLDEVDASGKSRPAEEIYAEAMSEMKDGNYEKSSKLLESLLSRYPYGRYAQQAQMELAYAQYMRNEPEAALAAVERFIKQYPTSPHVDYIYYLKGVISFNADVNILSTLVQQDISDRDPRSAQEAFDAFKDLLSRFPNSKYAPDAKVRMQYLINALARHEIHVARYYLRRGAYVAAVNRAKTVLSDYSQSPLRKDALEILVQAYDAMGMKELRDDAQRVLVLNSQPAKPVPQPGAQKPAPAAAPQSGTKP